eukprot:scaffold1265_cov366-Prasinococcus_capsulatus_cf.AAC.28
MGLRDYVVVNPAAPFCRVLLQGLSPWQTLLVQCGATIFSSGSQAVSGKRPQRYVGWRVAAASPTENRRLPDHSPVKTADRYRLKPLRASTLP